MVDAGGRIKSSGWPNGRRLGDDVVDIALTAVATAPGTVPSLSWATTRPPTIRSITRSSPTRRLLYNDLPGAIELMTQAAVTSGPRGEAAAWVRVELARLHLQNEDPDAADAALAAAQRAFPAHPGLAAVEAQLLIAQGRLQAAHELYRKSLATSPGAEVAVAAWRLARRLGREGEVRHLAMLLDGLARLDTGGLSRRALAEHFAETGATARALELARAELAQRPDIYSHATLARVLHHAGERQQAQEQARAALALGTPDAQLQADMGAILGKRFGEGARP